MRHPDTEDGGDEIARAEECTVRTHSLIARCTGQRAAGSGHPAAAVQRAEHVGRATAQVPPTSHYLVSPLEVAMITHAIFDRHLQLTDRDRRKRSRKITTTPETEALPHRADRRDTTRTVRFTRDVSTCRDSTRR